MASCPRCIKEIKIMQKLREKSRKLAEGEEQESLFRYWFALFVLKRVCTISLFFSYMLAITGHIS